MTALNIGNLVKARGREWVVLPGTTDDLAMLRPLGGTAAEETGVLTALERIDPAVFPLPSPDDVGDFSSGRLLRDALRLGFRSSAGPFRSFGRIAVQPRPYQYVPLLMALRMETVRLLIADYVGIGKTVESLLIARELLDTGEATRLSVLCSPQLAEQWRQEMASKFHLDAELVLPSTVRRLERHLRLDESIFTRYPITVVSTDFIKSDRHRHGFLRDAPDLVIVDEAHTAVAADGGGSGRGRHQRHELLKGLAADEDRHLLLVTATPHSGKEEGFRALLHLLDPSLAQLPEDLSGEHNRANRERLARHFVQRRRHDIARFLDTDTDFPERQTAETTYTLGDRYALAIDEAIAIARESVSGKQGTTQRVRWWSALALLRSMASSPAAAAQTLRNRAANAEATSEQEADEIGRRTVMDLVEDESAEATDVPPGAEDPDDDRYRRRLRDLARTMDGLAGDGDDKLTEATKLVKRLIKDGYNPILFCKFIPTAEYVAEHLDKALGKKVKVVAVTGTLPPEEREARIAELGEATAGDGQQRVLVATDCLSEGINLQQLFDAVVHYDLSWNPTRHEQREGRVDRLGQPSDTVRMLTFHGTNNRIDPIVLDVLLRKHEAIRRSTGVSVPVPGDASQVLEALTEGLFTRGDGIQLTLDVQAEEERDALHAEWEASAGKYGPRGRTIYAQATIDPTEVATEVEGARAAIGTGGDVRQFLHDVALAVGGSATDRPGPSPRLAVDLSATNRRIKELVGPGHERVRAAFEPPTRPGETLVTRTHPVVESLASHVVDTALDEHATTRVAARGGAVRTTAVDTRTTLLLVRMRFSITVATSGSLMTEGGRAGDRTKQTLLAEDVAALAFTGAPDNATWLPMAEAEALFDATATGPITQDQRQRFVGNVIHAVDHLRPALEEMATDRAADLRDAHVRVRQAARTKRPKTVTVDPHLPVDLLGVYVLLPDPNAATGSGR